MKINFKKILKCKKLIGLCVVFFICIIILPAIAADPSGLLEETGLTKAAQEAGLERQDTPASFIGIILGALAYLASTLLLILIIYGGYMWMTAGGNEEKVRQGQKYVIWAILGYLVIGISYILVNFIINIL